MFFSGSARLSEDLPELGGLSERLDELLRDVGAGDLLEPEALASELGVSAERLGRVLAAASKPPVGLLVAERYVVCPRCQMLNPAEEREAALEAGVKRDSALQPPASGKRDRRPGRPCTPRHRGHRKTTRPSRTSWFE